MQVFKFGGASVSTPSGVRNAAEIAQQHGGNAGLVVVVSAMGKTTNGLEAALAEAIASPGTVPLSLVAIRDYHLNMAHELLGEAAEGIRPIESLLDSLSTLLSHLPRAGYDELYDLVVPYGELLSSRIVQTYFGLAGIPCDWVDARGVLRTDSGFRSAAVDWDLSEALAQEAFGQREGRVYITQGFIGSTPLGQTTTLGREGSDYTATLLGAFLRAESVTIWKDVPGFLSADPKLFPSALPLEELDYREAIEMSFNGAKIIHPKAIKPVQNAGIPLWVRSFHTPSLVGTRIHDVGEEQREVCPPPLVAVREGVTLLSLTPNDLSFALEDNLGVVFSLLQSLRVKVRLIQNSAVSLSLCVDSDSERLPRALQALQQHFQVSYNCDLLLLTIRHYTDALRMELDAQAGILLCHTTRATRQYLMRTEDWARSVYPSVCDILARIAAQRSGGICVPQTCTTSEAT